MTARASVWRRYFLAGIAFQSVLIGGGYATGRELVEYFLVSEPSYAYAGLALAAACWSVVCALAFAHARVARTYDYRSFYRSLLGRAWVLYELAYVALLVLVLGVLGAAAGELAREFLGVAPVAATATFAILVAAITALGLRAVEFVFAAWGPLIYPAFGLLGVLAILNWPGAISSALASPAKPDSPWVTQSLAYAGYNLAVLASVLPFARYFQSTREAVISGLLCGPLAVIPGMFLITALLTQYPQVVDSPVPITTVLTRLESPWLTVAVTCVIFGTLVQTGVGIVNALVERLTGSEPIVARVGETRLRVLVPIVLLGLSVYLADQLGLIALIAQGYGAIAWIILLLTAVPLVAMAVRSIGRPVGPGSSTSEH